MTVTVPYDWLKQLPREAVEKGQGLPLLGEAPLFPWDQFSAVLAKVFQVEGLKVHPLEMRHRDAPDLFTGLGSKLVPLHFDVAPLEGSVCWVMEESDLAKLMAVLLTKDAQGSDFIDPDFRQGFYLFAALEALNIINKLDFDKTLNPHILSDTQLPAEGSLCRDISLSVEGMAITGRLILSDTLCRSWKEHFAKNKLSVDLPISLAQKVNVILGLQAGRTSLKWLEWESVHPGDFLVLDQCTLEPGENKGRVMLTLNGNPLFRAKVKEGSVKILESPLYHEVETTMSAADDNHDQDFDEESEEFHDEEFDEELEEEEFSEEAEEPSPSEVQGQEASPPHEAAQGTVSAAASKVGPKEIPLTIVVEVGRIQMSVQKLLELQPGSLLDLNIHPENGVDLVVNGSTIGRGELLKIGDSLGVRILDKA